MRRSASLATSTGENRLLPYASCKLAMSKEILFISRSRPDQRQHLARFDGMAGPAAQLADDSRRRGGDIDLHFHGFDDDQCLPFYHAITEGDIDLPNARSGGRAYGDGPVGEDFAIVCLGAR